MLRAAPPDPPLLNIGVEQPRGGRCTAPTLKRGVAGVSADWGRAGSRLEAPLRAVAGGVRYAQYGGGATPWHCPLAVSTLKRGVQGGIRPSTPALYTAARLESTLSFTTGRLHPQRPRPQTANEATDEAANEVADEAANEATDQAANEAAGKAANQATDEAANKAAKQASNESHNRAANQAAVNAANKEHNQAAIDAARGGAADEVSGLGHPEMDPPLARPRACKSCRSCAIWYRGWKKGIRE